MPEITPILIKNKFRTGARAENLFRPPFFVLFFARFPPVYRGGRKL